VFLVRAVAKVQARTLLAKVQVPAFEDVGTVKEVVRGQTWTPVVAGV
jgi:hypothetical protein